ncbi:MAG: 5'/3'-nucleotidase SurE [Pseudomonadota bacterium]
MRVLITNDDGIDAPGLEVMHEIALALTGSAEQVWTVAPASEQSGVGHCISFTQPMMVSQHAERRFAVHGTPADCVLAAVHEIMAGNLPDLVLAGVNRGNNSAENAAYSGTVGAAMEGALQGIRSIALSQYYGPRNCDLSDTFESSRQHGLHTVQALLEHGTWGGDEYGVFYNVNFPPVPGEEVLGMRACAQGYRKDGCFGVSATTSPSGRKFLWIQGSAQQTATRAGTDTYLNLEGYISVTPMRADLTAHDVLDPLKAIENHA